MAVHPPILIASVNMRKHNAVTHALLNSDNKTHLMLIQEPWFNTIGTARKDDARQGVDILGGASSPAWEIHYPGLMEGQHPKVMAYSCKQPQNDRDTTYFTVVPQSDICSHPTIQILDLIFEKEQWQVINFYHDI